MNWFYAVPFWQINFQSVASRVAEEMGVKLGEEVGYVIRFEDVTTPVRPLSVVNFFSFSQLSSHLYALFWCSITCYQCFSLNLDQFVYDISWVLLYVIDVKWYCLPVQGVTRIKFLTDGVLLREMMDDPLLSKYRYCIEQWSSTKVNYFVVVLVGKPFTEGIFLCLFD